MSQLCIARAANEAAAFTIRTLLPRLTHYELDKLEQIMYGATFDLRNLKRIKHLFREHGFDL